MNNINQNILDSNRLIAEFMGAKYKGNLSFNISEGELWLPIHGICRYDSIDLSCGKIIKYNSSWDWLMPVFEKICTTKIGDDITLFKYATPITFGMINEETDQFMVRLKGFSLHQSSNLIEATYNAVVEFIILYNQIKK